VFQEFEETPLAAPSIGQVHRAWLKDGEDVVVKVQRPGIHATIETDLEIMSHLATLIERYVEEWAYIVPPG
jgi:ubiquinone biosynthesis protein